MHSRFEDAGMLELEFVNRPVMDCPAGIHSFCAQVLPAAAKSRQKFAPMIIPIRCFTCNKEISSRYSQYLDKRRDGVPAGAALDELGMTRICCRRMYLGHVDIADQLLNFEKQEL